LVVGYVFFLPIIVIYAFCILLEWHFQVQVVLENLETKKIVLVHGEGFGAWCWYKTISLLEEAGLDPVALDLAGSGIDHTDANNISTLEEYSKPLIDYLSKLPENEKVGSLPCFFFIYALRIELGI
jgi:pimeloyl-ACP methyl ester carboxylesterase